MSVVYFYQCLGTVNSKRWSKSPFSCFSLFPEDFDAKKLQKINQKLASFGLFPNTGGHKNATGSYICLGFETIRKWME